MTLLNLCYFKKHPKTQNNAVYSTLNWSVNWILYSLSQSCAIYFWILTFHLTIPFDGMFANLEKWNMFRFLHLWHLKWGSKMALKVKDLWLNQGLKCHQFDSNLLHLNLLEGCDITQLFLLPKVLKIQKYSLKHFQLQFQQKWNKFFAQSCHISFWKCIFPPKPSTGWNVCKPWEMKYAQIFVSVTLKL